MYKLSGLGKYSQRLVFFWLLILSSVTVNQADHKFGIVHHHRICRGTTMNGGDLRLKQRLAPLGAGKQDKTTAGSSGDFEYAFYWIMLE